ncbi:helix-turn-helix domain-containing protein [Jeotgalibacillus salarius]|uniref:XRE family transcriptional regulator n=1 Tax=Jeotgalibacillus salarius TaxID=546023 RepID=A0A4Y8LMC0_9BACL|nr:helix-turn-helix transcriptional regulator [Jeotgalibacillus salarius]TFE02407.1 XRE family transcriptional regulator [Jeotgalibacillus salarius]
MSDFLQKYAGVRGKDHVQKLKTEGVIAAQIKSARKQAGLSQQQLADQAGIPKSTVGRIEAGITSPKVDTLFRLSRVLNTQFIIDGTINDDFSSAIK